MAKARTAKQKAATKRMIAANRKKRGGHKKGARKAKGTRKAKRSSKSHGGGLAALKRTVHHHSQMWEKQKRINSSHEHRLRQVFAHNGLSTPASARKLLKG